MKLASLLSPDHIAAMDAHGVNLYEMLEDLTFPYPACVRHGMSNAINAVYDEEMQDYSDEDVAGIFVGFVMAMEQTDD